MAGGPLGGDSVQYFAAGKQLSLQGSTLQKGLLFTMNNKYLESHIDDHSRV